MNRAQISTILRSTGLIYFTDWLRFFLEKRQNKVENQKFKVQNPEVILPPDYLMYESFQMNYQKYYSEGRETAKWLIQHFKKHIELREVKILDWGCGPARILRHLPSLVGEDNRYFGTDYNNKTIDWCKKNLKGIEFNLNTLEAKLPYSKDSFNAIYGISIFTHLSEQMHFDWYEELVRVLKPGGILFLTTQGDVFKTILTDKELKIYEKDKLVIRGKVKEGHRTYSCFHPKGFMENLFKEVEILEHIERPRTEGKAPPQDIWIVKKNELNLKNSV